MTVLEAFARKNGRNLIFEDTGWLADVAAEKGSRPNEYWALTSSDLRKALEEAWLRQVSDFGQPWFDRQTDETAESRDRHKMAQAGLIRPRPIDCYQSSVFEGSWKRSQGPPCQKALPCLLDREVTNLNLTKVYTLNGWITIITLSFLPTLLRNPERTLLGRNPAWKRRSVCQFAWWPERGPSRQLAGLAKTLVGPKTNPKSNPLKRWSFNAFVIIFPLNKAIPYLFF